MRSGRQGKPAVEHVYSARRPPTRLSETDGDPPGRWRTLVLQLLQHFMIMLEHLVIMLDRLLDGIEALLELGEARGEARGEVAYPLVKIGLSHWFVAHGGWWGGDGSGRARLPLFGQALPVASRSGGVGEMDSDAR